MIARFLLGLLWAAMGTAAMGMLFVLYEMLAPVP